MTREVWNNIPGSQLSTFIASPRYWQSANAISTFAGATAPSNAGDNFAARIRAHVTAPVTGNYTFWIASDDDSELYLSPNDSKFGRVKIASLSGWVNPQAWDAKTSQKSASIALVAGQRYFIEALHKDGGSLDHLAIAWQVPGGVRELIPASALESFTAEPNDLDNDELRDDWEAANGFSLTDNGTANPTQLPLDDPDHDGYSNLEESEFGTNPNVRGGVPGSLLLETWSNIGGSRIEDLTYQARFSGTPDKSEFIFAAETPANRADNFGARMRGCAIAPTTGDYTFYLSGDDDCQFWISPSGSQFARQKAAWLNGWSNTRQWTKFASQKSPVFSLVAGQKVYIEALQKESAGGDHLEIGWKTPGSTAISVIPGSALESYAYDANDAEGDNMSDDWENLHGLDSAINDASLDPDMDAIPNHLEASSNTDPQVKNTIYGALLQELWLNIPGYRVRAITSSSKFLEQPDFRALATSVQTFSQPYDGFGSRLRGYLTAPTTGSYIFWALGDDETELWLSTSNSKLDKQLLVRPTLNTSNFDTDLSQKSRPVTLVAGQHYYIEVLHKDYYGGDFCQIGWTKPGASREIIPGTALGTFIPISNDQDDDDLPDDWEIANGVSPQDNGHLNPSNGTQGDGDNDGLSNAEEFKAGTRADLADSDGDGITDHDEIVVLETQALIADAAPFQPVVSLNGSAFSDDFGSWFPDKTDGIQGNTRGWVEYDFSINTPGIHQVDLRMFPRLMGSSTDSLELLIDVDGQRLGRIPVQVVAGTTESVKALTPWLATGNHKIRAYIDNAVTSRRIGIQSIVIAAARGADANDNGVPDWVEMRLTKYNSFEAPSETLTSPVCVEGRARWSGLVSVAGASANPAPNERWYADVPLDDVQPTEIGVSFENGGMGGSREVNWITANLLTMPNLTIRLGDSLKLSAFSGQLPTPDESVVISLEGHTTTVQANQPLVYKFVTAGSIPVQVIHTANGNVSNISATVNVVAPPLLTSPVCVAGHWREWDIPILPAGVVVDLDAGLARETVSLGAAGTRRIINLDAADDHTAIARLWGGGPILGSTTLRGMKVRSGAETSLITMETSGGMTCVAMPVVIDGLWPDTQVKIEIFIGGVTFDDGSIVRSITPPQDCDVFGIAMVEFLKAGSSGSTCHRVSVWQGGKRIAWKE